MTETPSRPDDWSDAFAALTLAGHRVAFACACREPREVQEVAGAVVCRACGTPARLTPPLDAEGGSRGR